MPSETAKEVTANKWDVGALKLALDDAAKELFMKKHGLIETHKLFDGRLVLCTISVLIAAFGVLFDYLYPHPRSRTVLIACVSLYFLLSAIITLYVMFVEKNVFFTGLKEDKTGLDPADSWTACSYMNKYDPTYHFSLTVCGGITKSVKVSSVDKSAAEFFNIKGELQKDRYDDFLQNLVSDLYSDKKSH
uniref:Signal peptidase complex subunit 2 n=1 Tax=Schistosoma japonicum TaxID=6182 RepID=C1LQK5_SCHJA|nr:signal peptidase complex subunit 2 homolog [Schistosoma japonicum]